MVGIPKEKTVTTVRRLSRSPNLHSSNETVALMGTCFDAVEFVGGVGQHLAELVDGFVEALLEFD